MKIKIFEKYSENERTEEYRIEKLKNRPFVYLGGDITATKRWKSSQPQALLDERGTRTV
jgi:hypothetical protein